jgi:hypothetical protein
MRSEPDIREVTHKLGDVIQQPLLLDGAEMRITFSMGAAIFPDDADDGEVLFSQADRAMFHAKAQGRNQVCFFGDMSSKGIGSKELYIQNRLANAINAGQIQAWFQPIVCARHRRLRERRGAGALAGCGTRLDPAGNLHSHGGEHRPDPRAGAAGVAGQPGHAGALPRRGLDDGVSR